MPFFEHPAFAPLTIIFGSILLIIFTVLLFSYLSRRSKYRMIERLAEKGTVLTPEMLAGITSNGRGGVADKNPVTSGIFLMCIGVALAIFFWGLDGFQAPWNGGDFLPVIGIFPFMVGLARVLGARAAGRDESK
jgi:hypothetical protein